jgi:hypothetical protein
MWHWRRLETISWTDHVRNEKVLQRVKGERNFLHRVERRNVNWISHFSRKNCFLKHITEGKIEGRTGVTGKTRKKS